MQTLEHKVILKDTLKAFDDFKDTHREKASSNKVITALTKSKNMGIWVGIILIASITYTTSTSMWGGPPPPPPTHLSTTNFTHLFLFVIIFLLKIF